MRTNKFIFLYIYIYIYIYIYMHICAHTHTHTHTHTHIYIYIYIPSYNAVPISARPKGNGLELTSPKPNYYLLSNKPNSFMQR